METPNGRAEGLACADPGARTPIGASGNLNVLSKRNTWNFSGGGTGIGKAISEELLTLGAKVVIASRNEEKVAGAAKEMSKLGTIVSKRCNIRSEDDVK